MKKKLSKQPPAYYFQIVLRDGAVLKWTDLSKRKAASMYKWTYENLFYGDVRDYEWGEA